MSKARNTGNLNNAIQVSSTGAITFVSGSTTLATLNTSGQISGSSPVLFASTASFVANAQSASNAVSAQTASFANALTVAGTLTAQTLVVQTITSSVSTITGSTNFGTLAANTHTFTGSVLVSGSIGIGTTPNSTLHVRGDNGTSTAAVVRLRDTNTTARTTRLQFEDYTGNLADGLIDFRVGTAGNASTATLSIGVNSAGLTFSNTNVATFSNTVQIGTVANSSGNNLEAYGNNVRITAQDNNNGTAGYFMRVMSGASQVGNVTMRVNNAGSFQLYNGTSSEALNMSITSGGAATFASSITATTLALGSVTPASNGIYLNVPSANGANYGYIKTNALTVNTTQLILGSTYGYNTPVDALTIYNGTATFASSVTATRLYTGNSGISMSGYGSLSQTVSGQMTVLGHNLISDSSASNTITVVNGGWYSSMIRLYYNEGINFHTSTNVYSANAVYPQDTTLRMRITTGGNVLIGKSTDNGRGPLQVNGNLWANNINNFGLTLQGTGTPVSTGLPINAGGGGRTYLLLTSQQWDAGNSTSSTVTMIRCGYDGNNFTAVVLGSSNPQAETWSQSGGILHVAGNTNFQLNITVLSNN